jgi:Nucleotidyltransferase/DNA polymerase involved in DNA repair
MIALADCNNFYASCERVFNPGLKNKPIVVLSNNDGCIIARSNEAKELGIKMGVPVFQVRDIIDNNNVYVFSTNFALYGDMSSRVMSLLTDMAPETEIYSIDEAFMNFSGVEGEVRSSH